MAVGIVLISIISGFLGVAAAEILWNPGLLLLLLAYWIGGMLGSLAIIVLLLLRMPDEAADPDRGREAPGHPA